MSDHIILSVKRGNKISAPGKIQLLHGHPVDYFDPDIYNPELSEHCRSAFLFFKIPKTMLHLVQDILVVEDGDKYARKKQINFTKIGSEVNLQEITPTKNSQEILPIFDISSMAAEDIFKANKKNTVSDLAATAAGSKTIGSGGTDDFATWALAFADLANLTGDILFTQTTPVTETASAAITENLATHTFKCTSNKPHNGNPQMGHLLTFNHAGFGFYVSCEGAGNLILKKLHTKHTAAGSACRCDTVGAEFNFYLRDLLLDGNATGTQGLNLNDNTVKNYAHNLIIWDFTALGFSFTAVNAASIAENLSIRNCDLGFFAGAGQNYTARNVLSIANGTTDFANIAAATGRNNASEDATCADGNWNVGSGNQASITVANEIESTDDTNQRFMRLKKYSHYVRIAGILHKNGIAPGIAENITGIRGNVRPHRGGRYSIGADEHRRKLSCNFGMQRM